MLQHKHDLSFTATIFALALIGVVASLSWFVPSRSLAAEGGTINVRIQTENTTLFDGQVYVTASGCTVTDDAGQEHVITGAKAVCALDAAAQLGQFDYNLGYYDSFGLFLNRVASFEPTADYSKYWSLVVNYEMASVGLADYTVQEGDEVVLAFGSAASAALRLKVADNEVLEGKKLVVRVQRLVDAKKQTFAPVAGATVIFNDNISVVTDNFGKASFRPTRNTTAVTVYATVADAVNSATETITVMPKNTTKRPVSIKQQHQLAAEGIKLLSGMIAPDGMILNSQSLTEWAAMAFAAGDVKIEKRLSKAVVAYTPTAADGTTELARHILALTAIGFDPHSVRGRDYVARLQATRRGQQYGSAAFVNDDIFAGLALLAAGEDGNAPAVRRAIKAAKAGLKKDGGVSYAVAGSQSDVDTTTFFLQLVNAAPAAGNSTPIAAARRAANHWLTQQQNLDGGFGYAAYTNSNSASSAVVLQALNSREHPTATILMRNRRTVLNYLAAVQKPNGLFAYSTTVSSSYDALNTAYAVIGLYQKSLPAL